MSITCFVRYQIDPFQREAFKEYAQNWGRIIPRCGGQLLGYFLPHEGPNNIALALFSFPSLAAYETYRKASASDSECQAAMRYYEETKCFLSFERSFMRPVFEK